ncbi:hypothetical protein AAON49_12600 [Pseudotenacibaculum sp. MALMAid0570]
MISTTKKQSFLDNSFDYSFWRHKPSMNGWFVSLNGNPIISF